MEFVNTWDMLVGTASCETRKAVSSGARQTQDWTTTEWQLGHGITDPQADGQCLPTYNGTFTSLHRSLHVDCLWMHQERHLWCTSSWWQRRWQLVSLSAWPGLPDRPGVSRCRAVLFEAFLGISCATGYRRGLLPYTVTTRKSGKTCFVVVEGFSWTE